MFFPEKAAMLNRSRIIATIFACALMSASIASAFAGDVKLVSDTWENVCGVEITWGADAPNGTPAEFHSDVPRNWSVTKPDRLCYRRASTPDNCDSGMTQWKTQWKCAASAGADTKELSLE
jgi:hypothetical protein